MLAFTAPSSLTGDVGGGEQCSREQDDRHLRGEVRSEHPTEHHHRVEHGLVKNAGDHADDDGQRAAPRSSEVKVTLNLVWVRLGIPH